LYIYYEEGVQSRLITFMLNQTWATYSEAVEAGLATAKRAELAAWSISTRNITFRS
jgi:hypothetical protein